MLASTEDWGYIGSEQSLGRSTEHELAVQLLAIHRERFCLVVLVITRSR